MRVEQMLHGYDNGHRLLAGSVLLKNSTDMDTIATLSDWSEYVNEGGESTYMTAYPLVNSNYYVVAKTWYAEEMKRPGCVWTHSLLIPFEALNIMDDFKQLNNLFVRPVSIENLDSFSQTIDYELKNISPEDYIPLSINRGIAGQILHSFVYNRNTPIYLKAIKDKELIEVCLLSIMNIFSLDFLHEFSWCTGSAYIRKLNGMPLTCQFFSRENNDMKVFTTQNKEEKWLSYVLDGIIRGDVNQGQLIRMFANDIADKSSNFIVILKVLYTLDDYFKTEEKKEERYKAVLDIIAKAFPSKNEGKIIKNLCTNKIFTSRYCDTDTFFYFWATLQDDIVLDETHSHFESRWTEYLSTNRNNYVDLLTRIADSRNVNERGKSILRNSVNILTLNEIEKIIKNSFHLFSVIVKLNPSILDSVVLAKMSTHDIDAILPMIIDENTCAGFSHWDLLFQTLLDKNMDISRQLASLIFGHTENATSILLNFVNSNDNRHINSVLETQLRERQSMVLSWLVINNTITVSIANVIVNTVDIQSKLVLLLRARVWRPFLRLQYHSLSADVYVFLFILSFNWRSDKDALDLMRMAFYPLHVLVACRELEYSYWIRVAPYLDSVMFWEDWDKCKKLRKTVISRLKKEGACINTLENYTPDANLNALLKKMW